jgi:hypothetical protein
VAFQRCAAKFNLTSGHLLIESLVVTLKEGFEFGEMVRRTHENVLAEMLEKVLAYNISRIIRVWKKLSEPEEMERAVA